MGFSIHSCSTRMVTKTMYTQAFRSFPRSFRSELLTCKLNLWLSSWGLWLSSWGFMTSITLLVSQPPPASILWTLKRVDRRNNNSPVNLLPCSPSAALGQPKPRVDTVTPPILEHPKICGSKLYIFVYFYMLLYSIQHIRILFEVMG